MTHHTACFLVFRVSFLVCIFSAMFAHIYFTVVSRLSSVRSGRARSTPTRVVLSGFCFPNSMDGNVVIPPSDSIDVTLHMPVSRVLLSRNGLDIVVPL